MFFKHTDLTDFYTDDIFFLTWIFFLHKLFFLTRIWTNSCYRIREICEIRVRLKFSPCALLFSPCAFYYCSPCAIEPRISMASTSLTMAVIGAYGGCLRHIRCLSFVLTQLSASGCDRARQECQEALQGVWGLIGRGEALLLAKIVNRAVSCKFTSWKLQVDSSGFLVRGVVNADKHRRQGRLRGARKFAFRVLGFL